MDTNELMMMLERWQSQENITKNQALKILELAIQLSRENENLQVEVSRGDETCTTSKNCEPRLTLRHEYVSNGHSTDSSGNRKLFGPYLYGYWRENGKLRKKYIGKIKSI